MLLHRRAIFALLAAGLFTTSSAIIVWNGQIVAEWPEEATPFLRKTVADKADSTAPKGFGFFTRPTGNVYGLTMIVDFSDEQATFTKQQVDDWLNTPGFSTSGTKGSVRDYFYECSNGILELKNDVVGYYRAKNPRSYYESSSGYSGAGVLVSEMIAYFDPTVDFSKYDNDKNGTTECINFVYAGSGKTWGQGLWPHSGTVGQTKDGVKLGRYNMCDMGSSLTLYVFCHETGHMLFGWPDLYWFGDYCIMGNRMNDKNPQAINDFFRADQGWIPTTDIVASDNKAFTASHNKGGFRYVNPASPQELYYWSVVKTDGRWANVAGDGILLYHFDAKIRGNTSAVDRILYLVEADGNNSLAKEQWPSPGFDAKDFFNSANNATFAATTTPASTLGLRIYEVSAAAETMSFKVGTGIVAAEVPHIKPVNAGTIGNETVPLFNLLGRAIGSPLTGGKGSSRGASGYLIVRKNRCGMLQF